MDKTKGCNAQEPIRPVDLKRATGYLRLVTWLQEFFFVKYRLKVQEDHLRLKGRNIDQWLCFEMRMKLAQSTRYYALFGPMHLQGNAF